MSAPEKLSKRRIMNALTKLNTQLYAIFPYSPYYFSIWRILFGIFLTFYSFAIL